MMKILMTKMMKIIKICWLEFINKRWDLFTDNDGQRKVCRITGETKWWVHMEEPGAPGFWSKYSPDELVLME